MFGNKEILEERLKTIRKIPDSKNNLAYRDKCWGRFKSEVPMNRYKLSDMSDEDMQDALIAHQVFFYDEIKRRILDGAGSGEPDKSDLSSFLNTPLDSVRKESTLLRKTQGLNYIKPYVRDVIYGTKVKGKHPNPIKNLDIVRDFHRAICSVFIFNPGIEAITASKLTTTMQLTGSVMVVSNFRPLCAAYIFQKYGVDLAGDKVNICCPSEGFLGRTLASYYIALRNPKKEINYYTIDPNQALVEPFNKFVADLKKSGGIFNQIKNWNLIFHTHGSEVPEANFKERYGVEIDLCFTSPPYFDAELYLNTWELYICPKDFSLQEQNDFISKGKGKGCKVVRLVEREIQDKKAVSVGSEYEGGVICKINKNTQSHTFGKTVYTWIENFFRPTVRNCIAMTKKGGYIIWNVSNVKRAMNLEDEVVKCCKEEGLELVETLKYELSRRPGDGSKGKKPYEPIFVFRKSI